MNWSWVIQKLIGVCDTITAIIGLGTVFIIFSSHSFPCCLVEDENYYISPFFDMNGSDTSSSSPLWLRSSSASMVCFSSIRYGIKRTAKAKKWKEITTAKTCLLWVATVSDYTTAQKQNDRSGSLVILSVSEKDLQYEKIVESNKFS